MDTWDKLIQDEKDWIKEHGYGEKDVNENPVECTINMLWPEYACRGYTLHDAEEMVRRLKKEYDVRDDTVSNGDHVFQLVNRVPLGYEIWNIGKNMVPGYLPFCRVITGSHSVEVETLKAIRIDGAERILAAIGGGQNTIAKMERYVKRYKNSPTGSWPNLQVERMQRALPIMKQLKWD